MRRSLFLLLFISLSACEEKSAYTPTEHEQRIMGAYASVALLYDSFPPTTLRDSVALYTRKADSLLAQYGFTREDFRSEFEALLDSPQRLQPMLQELSSQVQKEMRKR